MSKTLSVKVDKQLLKRLETMAKAGGVSKSSVVKRGIELALFEKLSFGDALIASVVDQNRKILDAFISWNAHHFKDKLDIEAFSPSEFLQ